MKTGSFLNLFLVASMPVLKVLLVTAMGLFLALSRIDILGKNARHHLNRVVFYVFGPALVGSNLAKTVTFKSFLILWFMPINILITFLIGSALGWVLGKVTRSPKPIKALILASCSAGNLGALVVIIVPALCKEKGSPFGAPDVCETFGLAYASLSMAIGSIYIWLYAYNIVRISSREVVAKTEANDNGIKEEEPNQEETLVNVTETSINDENFPTTSLDILPNSSSKSMVASSFRVSQCLKTTLRKNYLKALLAPSTIGAMVGFFVGTIHPFRKLLIGDNAPLHVVGDTASMLGELENGSFGFRLIRLVRQFLIGDAAIPSMTLILGANLLRGLKGSRIKVKIVMGIIVVRYLLLPLLGILIVKGAVRGGLVPSHDPLFQFILMLQYALPPAMSIGTITQLFGAGESECSVIMLWTYPFASAALTLWSTVFLCLV